MKDAMPVSLRSNRTPPVIRKTETVAEYLARGGTIQRVEAPEPKPVDAKPKPSATWLFSDGCRWTPAARTG